MERIAELLEQLNSIIVNDEKRQRFQFDVVIGVFIIVSFVMTVLNVVTSTYPLGIVTAVFCVLCILNVYLSRTGQHGYRMAMVFFAAELVAMFAYFIVTGGTDNFSIIWIALLPAIGISFFGIKTGSVISAIVFAIMLLCFHVPPFSTISTTYNATFAARFPIIYVSAYILSLVMELIRLAYVRENLHLQEEYKYLSMHDALTDLRNRYGYKDYIDQLKQSNCESVAEAIFDIDFFKKINDTYGHDNGDVVLRDIAKITVAMLPKEAEAFRWGGEEFIIIFKNADLAAEYCESLRGLIASHIFTLIDGQKININVSIGLAVSEKTAKETNFERLFILADDALYEAKETGRNKMVVMTMQD